MNEFLNYELFKMHSTVITVGNIVAALLILVGTRVLLRFLTMLVRRSMRARQVQESRHGSLIQLVGYVVWTFGIILILQSLSVDITFLVASSAALLVGIGLGLQNVFKDFVAGIIILIDGTVKPGDVVEVGGWVVKVKDVSLRTSSVLTREDNIVLIPNHKFIEENVVNWTFNASPSRFELEVGVDYGSDIRLVEKVLTECALRHPDALKTQPYTPFVRLYNFGSSSFDFQLVFWSNNLFRIESAKSQIRFFIVDAFQEHGILIPFTQMVLHHAPEIVSQ